VEACPESAEGLQLSVSRSWSFAYQAPNQEIGNQHQTQAGRGLQPRSERFDVATIFVQYEKPCEQGNMPRNASTSDQRMLAETGLEKITSTPPPGRNNYPIPAHNWRVHKRWDRWRVVG